MTLRQSGKSYLYFYKRVYIVDLNTTQQRHNIIWDPYYIDSHANSCKCILERALGVPRKVSLFSSSKKRN